MKLFIRTILCLLLIIIYNSKTSADEPLDRDAGKAGAKLAATGFFRVVYDRGGYWLAAPDGAPFYSIGSNTVQPYGDYAPRLRYSPYNRNVLAKRGSETAWAELVKTRLTQWGFNCLGGWSTTHVKLPYFKTLSFCGGSCAGGKIPDFFTDKFAEDAEKNAASSTNPDDTALIGYFIDNEMQFAPDWRFGPAIFDLYAGLPANAPGKIAFRDFFRKKYGTTERMADVWNPPLNNWDDLLPSLRITPVGGAETAATDDREAFTYLVAHRYYSVIAAALRKHDPNHLIACNRLVSWTTPAAVALAAGEFCDIVSINHYELGPIAIGHMKNNKPSIPAPGGADPSFARYFQVARRPLLISEFSFRAMDSGLPNSYPPPSMVQPNVSTQTARAKKYAHYVLNWAAQPFFVGHHWFEYMDEPKEGRFDGENGNYGLVNIEDEPYTAFVDSATKTNSDIWSVHRNARFKNILDEALAILPDRLSYAPHATAADTDPETVLARKIADIFAASIKNNAEKIVIAGSADSGSYVVYYVKKGSIIDFPDVPRAAGRRLWEETRAIAASDLSLIGIGLPGWAFKASRSDNENGAVLITLTRWPEFTSN